MTLKRWYQLCLILPIFVPLLFGLICWVVTGSFMGNIAAPRPEPVMPFAAIPVMVLAGFTQALMLSLWLSGLSYLVFAGTMLWWLRHKDAVYLGRMSYLMPLLFYPFFAVGLSLTMQSPAGAAFAFIAIPYGYIYVFLAHMLTWAVLKSGRINDTLN